MIKSTTIGTLALFLTGCQSQLLHYKVLDKSPEFRAPTISAFAITPQADDAPAFIRGLSDRGQAALIQAFAASAKDAKPDDILALVAKDHGPDGPDCGAPHPLVLKKRIVFNLSGQQVHQADRIDRVDLHLRIADTKPQQPSAKIVSWDRFDTKYDSYNLGSATYTQSGKTSLGKASSESITAGAEYESGLQETVAYSMRKITLGGNLTEGGSAADLLLEGGPLIGLFGSFSAVVSLQVETSTRTPSYVHKLSLSKDGADLTAEKASVERCLDSYAERAKEIVATVDGIALNRVAVEGFETVTESDDRVSFQPYPLGKVSFPLVKEDELAAVRYGLVKCVTTAGVPASCAAIRIETEEKSGTFERLALRSPQEARALRAWLVHSSKTVIGTRKIALQNAQGNVAWPLTQLNAQDLQIRVVGGNTDIATDF
ncbi:hypothetical protein KGA65_18635 [Ideonella sp. B7]|uniref:hypothetical protein n=1 Tax=Ideonella benzenivorans TaxID=2831643 RepID=UPI001CECCB63|nr:hypothetical protein [Ideonella benzenivorans]MCA6218561.1 hypothetical protein [Ideonella benzenivorans]